MSDSHNLGRKGEDIAAAHLEKKGYKIVKRNWKAGKLEVDIIAENKDYLVFIEVKSRSEDYLVSPASAVNREKQRSMILCADNYIRWNGIKKEIRFDVITVVMMSDDSFNVEHIENAFYPTLR
jgi:putative endonuclease